MRPSTRVAKLLESCNPTTTLEAARSELERMIIDAENAALLGASIDIENNYFQRFTQADAAHLVRQKMRQLPPL